ncbi:SynChlorMet cassette protein ScmC [Thermodesulfobacteriota bacterium]
MSRLTDETRTSRKRSPAHTPAHSAYTLSLSDGNSWCLTGDQHTCRFLDKFAAIMELKECPINGFPKIILRSDNANKALNGLIQMVPPEYRVSGNRGGWSFYDLNTLRIWYHQHMADVLCEVKDIKYEEIEFISMWSALLPIYQRSIGKGGLPFHAGLAERDGRGFLLAAPGHTGKSTCCRRLPSSWRQLSDDETLVVLDQQKRYRAHPFPTWSDYLLKRSEKTWDVQYSVPLSGIFFLEQSETDHASLLGEGKAAVLITESAMQICNKFWTVFDKANQRLLSKGLFDNACEMAKQIPAYRLKVSLHGRFWEKIEQILV